MNWVGGSRNRIGLRTVKKVQKEYFEKKRQNRKMNNFRSLNEKNGISQDLIALHTLNTAYSGMLTDKANQVRKPIQKIDIDKGKNRSRRFQVVDLPHSPIETPSKLSLEDTTSWNLNSWSIQNEMPAHSRIATKDDSRFNREVYVPKLSTSVDYLETDYSQNSDNYISETYSTPNTQLSAFAVVPSFCKNERMEPIESSESPFSQGTQHYWEHAEFQNAHPISKHESPFISTFHQIKMSKKYHHSNGSLSPLSLEQQVNYPIAPAGKLFRSTAQLSRTKKEIAINNFTEFPHSQLLKSIHQTTELWQIPIFEDQIKETSCSEIQDKTESEYYQRCETELDANVKDKQQYVDYCISPSYVPQNLPVSQFYTDSSTCQPMSQSTVEENFNKIKPLSLQIDSSLISLSPVISYTPVTEHESTNTQNSKYSYLNTPQPVSKITEHFHPYENSLNFKLSKEKTDQTEVNCNKQDSSKFVTQSPLSQKTQMSLSPVVSYTTPSELNSEDTQHSKYSFLNTPRLANRITEHFQPYGNSLNFKLSTEKTDQTEVNCKIWDSSDLVAKSQESEISLSPVLSHTTTTEVESRDTQNSKYNVLNTPQPVNKITEHLQLYENSLSSKLPTESTDLTEVNCKIEDSSDLVVKSQESEISLSPVLSHTTTTEVESRDTQNSKYNVLNTPQPVNKITEHFEPYKISLSFKLSTEKTDLTEVNCKIEDSSDLVVKSQESEYLTPLSNPPINAQTQTDFHPNVIDASTSPIVFPQIDQMIQCYIVNSQSADVEGISDAAI